MYVYMSSFLPHVCTYTYMNACMIHTCIHFVVVTWARVICLICTFIIMIVAITLLLPNHNWIFQAWIYEGYSVLTTRLSALEVLHNICNMGTYDLPDMYACSPWALGR